MTGPHGRSFIANHIVTGDHSIASDARKPALVVDACGHFDQIASANQPSNPNDPGDKLGLVRFQGGDVRMLLARLDERDADPFTIVDCLLWLSPLVGLLLFGAMILAGIIMLRRDKGD